MALIGYRLFGYEFTIQPEINPHSKTAPINIKRNSVYRKYIESDALKKKCDEYLDNHGHFNESQKTSIRNFLKNNGGLRGNYPNPVKLKNRDVYYLGENKVRGKQVKSYIFPLRVKDMNRIMKSKNKQPPTTKEHFTKALNPQCVPPPISGVTGWTLPTSSVLYDPSNPFGLTSLDILNTLQSSIGKWNNAKGGTAFFQNRVFGTATFDVNGINEYGFSLLMAPFDDAIAVTIIQVSFSGEIVEADMIFNIAYAMNLNPGPGEFHFPTISDHEWGHWFGLDHPPTLSQCLSVVLYAFIGPQEIKSTLTEEDATGIQTLYPLPPTPPPPTNTLPQNVASRHSLTNYTLYLSLFITIWINYIL